MKRNKFEETLDKMKGKADKMIDELAHEFFSQDKKKFKETKDLIVKFLEKRGYKVTPQSLELVCVGLDLAKAASKFTNDPHFPMMLDLCLRAMAKELKDGTRKR